MKYQWIENISEFHDIAGEWDNALVTSGNYNPFLLSDFIITWWKYFNDKLSLRIFVVYNDDKIASGLPLYLKREGLKNGFADILNYIGGTAANYTEPLYVSAEIELLPLLQEALSKRKDWDVLYLTDLRIENRLMAEVDGRTPDKRFFFRVTQDHVNWAIDLSEGKSSFLKTISKKLRRDLRAKRKHAIKDYGEIKLEGIKGQKEIEHYFDIFTDFSLHTFNKRNRKSSFENEKYAKFFKEFLIIMQQKQRLDAHVLFAGEVVLAISFGYRFGKGFNWVLTGFNYECKYVRPGYLLIEELIDEIIKRGETYYNWYGYDRFYKSQWCNKQFPLYGFLLIRYSAKGIIYRALRYIERMLRANGALVNLFRTMKKLFKKEFLPSALL